MLFAIRIAHSEILTCAEDMLGQMGNGLVVLSIGVIGKNPFPRSAQAHLTDCIALTLPEAVQCAE